MANYVTRNLMETMTSEDNTNNVNIMNPNNVLAEVIDRYLDNTISRNPFFSNSTVNKLKNEISNIKLKEIVGDFDIEAASEDLGEDELVELIIKDLSNNDGVGQALDELKKEMARAIYKISKRYQ